jgi:hypothetical protein
VGEGLAELMKGRTVLVIAHRLSTVRDADLIAVLEGAGGGVRHPPELVARGGAYTRLLGEGPWRPEAPALPPSLLALTSSRPVATVARIKIRFWAEFVQSRRGC